MNKEKSADRKIDNQHHHFDYWAEDYKTIKRKYAEDAVRFLKIKNRLSHIEREMCVMDANRREHAVRMGVDILDSDKQFCFEAEKRGVAAFIEEINRMLEDFGYKFEDVVSEDNGNFVLQEGSDDE